MDRNKPNQWSAFLELHSGNPREGPGGRASTEKALQIARQHGCEPRRILDLACGPGMQTRHLAALAPLAHITALDLHDRYVQEVQAWITGDGLDTQVAAVRGDMSQPPVEKHSFDLIWCEGAAYMLGVTEALACWRDWLTADAGATIAFSEPVFLSSELPQAVVDNWAEYPAMSDLAGIHARVKAAGFRVVGDFVLPDAAWAAYYEPLQLRVNELRKSFAADPERLAIVEEGQQEIDAWRNHGEHFSYAFLVAQPD